MTPRTLDAALRLRREAVEAARQDLALALDGVEATRRTERAAIGAITEEAEAATQVTAGDLAVESFAAWLPEGRRAVAAARAASDEAEAKAVLARAALTAARTAEAAIESLIAEQARTARDRARDAEQAGLDDTLARRSADRS